MGPKESQKTLSRLPAMFRPLLWGLQWERLDVYEDKEDIIVQTVNEGNIAHWRWIIKTYGKNTIRRILEKRLITEFHPESRHLARVIFGVKKFRHARTGLNYTRTRTVPSTR